MSIVASYVAGDFLVIATDTRVIRKHPGSSEIIDDSSRKLYQTELGWGSGAGHHDFIKAFFVNLTQCSVGNSRDVRLCYYNTYLWTCQERPGIVEAVNATKVLFSYIAREGDLFSPRIGVLGKDFFESSTGVLERGNLFVLWPDDISGEVAGEFNGRYCALAKDRKEINEILFIMSGLIREMSGISKTVSGICDFGVTVLMDGALSSFNIREPAADVEQACLDGTLNKYIRLC
ncbi:MAG TPA: hypothetical protein PK728_09055 [Bacillota bacterium]|nr:hypothetical protein [Bacillota bacterium]